MPTFSLSQCPHCAQANAKGTVSHIGFSSTEMLNVAITGHCQACQKPLMGLGKIAFEHRGQLADVRHRISQHQGPLESLALIQLIRWVPLSPTPIHS